MAKSPQSKSVAAGKPADSPNSPKTPPRTGPLAEEQRGAWFDGPDMVTAICEYDGTPEFDLPRDIQTFKVGASSSCDIALPGRGLSAKHCILERRGAWLHLIDRGSTHGIYYQDRRVDEARIGPGDTFTAAPVTFLAMNDEMRKYRPTIADIIGSNSVPSPDKLLIEAARGSSNLLLTGESNCDQDRLARAIHAVSLRRTRPLVAVSDIPEDRTKQRELIDKAARSSLVLSLTDEQPPLDRHFVSAVCAPSYHVRLIVVAPGIDVARRVLTPTAADQMTLVWVRPLMLRSNQIDRLLDRMFEEREALIRSADLTDRNRAALRAHDWPNNFADLRLLVDRILAYESHGGFRPTAKALGMPKSTLQKYFTRHGMSTPLLVR